jgi:nitrogen-specific signal transduction histidine kinase
MSDINLENWIKENLFNTVPTPICVIDQAYTIVYANKAFEKKFGNWHENKCYSIFKSRNSVCQPCKWPSGFTDGSPKIHREVGFDKNGRLTTYINHTFPISDNKGNIPYAVVMTVDTTEADSCERENKLLFDAVPCSILLIDRSFHIVRTNQRLRDEFGDLEGQYCYQALKGLAHRCEKCATMLTFNDGQPHSDIHTWKTPMGDIHKLVRTVPLREADGSFDVVMEMTVDITKSLKLEEELRKTYSFITTMISASFDGIFAINSDGDVSVFNKAARDIFQVGRGRRITKDDLMSMLPEGLLDQVAESITPVLYHETIVSDMSGEKVPVRLAGINLLDEGSSIGMSFFIQDIREVKKLEKEKMEAERLAAVGQTVAGLAHGVKNLLTGLEGGMYMLNTGLQKLNIERVQKGVDMLTRNIDRISIFVKAFLSYAKGREIQVKLSNPIEIANEVVELYVSNANNLGIELKSEQIGNIAPALIDYESMHECLTNLVGNAIDACRISDKEGGCRVTVKTYEHDNTIIYEVTDNGSGMDYEVKTKVFTSFFTTKGLGGSGIGLLMTKKIVQEHGGTIEMESEHGKGSVFRIKLPRNRLPKSADTSEQIR